MLYETIGWFTDGVTSLGRARRLAAFFENNFFFILALHIRKNDKYIVLWLSNAVIAAAEIRDNSVGALCLLGQFYFSNSRSVSRATGLPASFTVSPSCNSDSVRNRGNTTCGRDIVDFHCNRWLTFTWPRGRSPGDYRAGDSDSAVINRGGSSFVCCSVRISMTSH